MTKFKKWLQEYWWVVAILMVVNWVVPDPIPWIDELVLTWLTLEGVTKGVLK